jgi:hypothetical protein
MNYDTHHARFRDDIGAFLAGGLSDADRRAFEDHAAHCPECAAALAAAAAQDADLQGLFAVARPGEALEERMVRRFRDETVRDGAGRNETLRERFRLGLRLPAHPAIRRAAVGVAAALLLGGFGYAATQAVSNGGLPTPWTFVSSRAKTAGNLRQISQGVQRYANENKGRFPEVFYTQVAGKEITVDRQSAGTPQDMARQFNDTASTAWGEAATGKLGRDVASSGADVKNGRHVEFQPIPFQSVGHRDSGPVCRAPPPAAAPTHHND